MGSKQKYPTLVTTPNFSYIGSVPKPLLMFLIIEPTEIKLDMG